MAFFDKIGEVAKSVTEKAGDSLEINKLGSDINIEKGNIREYQREIGEYYWSRFVVGDKLDDEAMFICDKIVVSQDHIRELEDEIEKVKSDREDVKAERAEARRIAKEEEERLEKEAEDVRKKAEAASAAAVGVVADEAVPEASEEIVVEDAAEVVEVIPVVEEAVVVDAAEQKYCGNCGGKLGGQRFCPFCGQGVE